MEYKSTQISLPAGFQQFKPPDRIRNIVQYIWHYISLEDITTVAVPEGSTDIVFELKRRTCIIFGPSDRPFYFNSFGMEIIGFCLYPGYLQKITKISVSEFINSAIFDFKIPRFPVKDEWWYKSEKLCQAFCDHIFTIVSEKQNDDIRRIIIPTFALSTNLPNVKDLSKAANLSQRSLHRYSKKYFGVSPKIFLKTIRFQQALKILKKGGSFLDATHGAGYFDQAHFCHDFKSFTNKTPSVYFLGK